MGNSGNGPAASAEDIAGQTHFSIEEVNDLMAEFKKVSPNMAPINEKKFDTLCELMASKYPNPVYSDPAYRKIIFAYSDTDGNKKVDVAEAVGTLSIMSRGSREEKAKVVFKSFDKNGDGTLTRGELKVGFMRCFEQLRASCKQLVDDMKDEMKKTGAPSFMVNMAMSSFKPGILYEVWVGALLDQFILEVDSNSDGKVSFDEFVAAAGTSESMTILLEPGSPEAIAHLERYAPSLNS